MINSVALTGRLTRDVDLRYTQSGIAVGTFTLAVDRQFKSAQGERETDFITCAIWRKGAENLSNFTHKGALIGVQGHLQTRNYDNAQGQRVYVTEVIVESFSLLEPKGAAPAQSPEYAPQAAPVPPQGPAGTTTPAPAWNAPTGASRPQQAYADPFVNNGQPIDVMDEDLPF